MLFAVSVILCMLSVVCCIITVGFVADKLDDVSDSLDRFEMVLRASDVDMFDESEET